ncbi:hypothetical protein Bca4012_077397 [Brassica carinata]|uniref:No apical meristem-associated C-terminal domain-containing protein n=1 Tax=Brassica carinata TaxID=52824 RepID=A0A8X7Q920_BRACI|nr:hypothetical protein Bca52824_072337 [Brassica carinata]
MAISLLHGVSPQRNGVSLSGSCRRKKTAFLYRFLSSTKENGEISLAEPFYLSDKTPTIVHEGKTFNPNFVGLLNSQQDIAFGSYEDSVELSSSQVPFLPTQGTADSNFVGNTPPDCKERRNSKKRKGDEDGADCSSSQPTETMRLEGVKAAKAHGKKTVEFQSMVSLKQQDLVMKDRLSKNMLLDSLITKKEPLDDEEHALKKKLISDLLYN